MPPSTTPESYADPERDALFIEDQSGRVRLVGDKIQPGTEFARMCITGVVVGILGIETPQGDLHVVDVQAPGIPAPVAQPPGRQGGAKVALLSGLGLGGRGDAAVDAAFDMLTAWLAGDLGGERIPSAVIAGNSVPAAAWHADVRSDDPQFNPYEVADPQLARLCDAMDALVVLPGSDDPTSLALPQQPLLRPLMPRAAVRDSLACVTNPTWFALYGRTVLATSGQNVDDIVRYAVRGACAPLEAARLTLECAHIAPTAPDTLCA